MTNTDEQEQRAQILVEQTDRLLALLPVDVSSVPIREPTHIAWTGKPAVFRLAADAYDRLAQAEKQTQTADRRTIWERTKEQDGRTGDDLMKLLWALLEEIKKG
jgi:hypothetical protein